MTQTTISREQLIGLLRPENENELYYDVIAWVRNSTLPVEQLCDACERASWLLQIAEKTGVDPMCIVRAACACARTTLKYVSDSENSPRRAVETAERFARGEATLDDVRAAVMLAERAATALLRAADQSLRKALAALPAG